MRKKRSPLVTVGILVVALLSVLIGSAIGKYVTTVPVPGKVTFHANLGTITLQEHAVVRNPDGSYSLTEDIATADKNGNFNAYSLLPGVDIPKDPFVKIENKSPIEAYVFVEVVDTLAETKNGTTYTPITYTVSSDWLKLEGVTGKNGGAVYVYKGNDTKAKPITTNMEVQILAPLAEGKPETIRVSQTLIAQSVSDGGDVLEFYACMGEVAMGADTAAVYKAINNII